MDALLKIVAGLVLVGLIVLKMRWHKNMVDEAKREKKGLWSEDPAERRKAKISGAIAGVVLVIILVYRASTT